MLRLWNLQEPFQMPQSIEKIQEALRKLDEVKAILTPLACSSGVAYQALGNLTRVRNNLEDYIARESAG
jgi:hypothetical protein